MKMKEMKPYILKKKNVCYVDLITSTALLFLAVPCIFYNIFQASWRLNDLFLLRIPWDEILAILFVIALCWYFYNSIVQFRKSDLEQITFRIDGDGILMNEDKEQLYKWKTIKKITFVTVLGYKSSYNVINIQLKNHKIVEFSLKYYDLSYDIKNLRKAVLYYKDDSISIEKKKHWW